jgi:hypothetical protein
MISELSPKDMARLSLALHIQVEAYHAANAMSALGRCKVGQRGRRGSAYAEEWRRAKRHLKRVAALRIQLARL